MEDILTKAREYRADAAARALGHEISAEAHRQRGAGLGIAATALSAAVSTTIFAAVTSQVGISGNRTITIPQSGWGLVALVIVSLMLILSPVLAGVQSYLNDPSQVEKHRTSWAGYSAVQRRLDRLLCRYGHGDLPPTAKEDALKELEATSLQIEELCKNCITLTPGVLAKARKKIHDEMQFAADHPAAREALSH